MREKMIPVFNKVAMTVESAALATKTICGLINSGQVCSFYLHFNSQIIIFSSVPQSNDAAVIKCKFDVVVEALIRRTTKVELNIEVPYLCS